MIWLDIIILNAAKSICIHRKPFFCSALFSYKVENLVLGARSKMTGFAIDQICSWFQVSVAWFKGSAFKGSEVKYQQKKVDAMSEDRGEQPACDEVSRVLNL